MNPFLGIALGAGTQEWGRQEENRRQNETADRQKQEAARQAEQFGWLRQEQQRRQAMQQAQDEVLKWGDGIQKRMMSQNPEDQMAAAQELSNYHNSTDWMGGTKSQVYRDPSNGQLMVAYGNADEGPRQTAPVTPQFAQEQLQAAMAHRLAATDPSLFMQRYDSDRNYGLKKGELDVHSRHAATQQQHATDQGRLIDWQIQKGNEMLPWQEKLIQAQIAHYNQPPQGPAPSFQPLQGGYSYNQRTGQTIDSTTGQPVTDRKVLEGIHKMGQEPKPQLSPEQAKDYRANLIALGPRPAPKRGWTGTDDTAGQRWDAQKSHLDRVYRIAPPQTEMPPIPVMAPPGAQQAPAPQADPQAQAIPYARGVQSAIAARNRQQ